MRRLAVRNHYLSRNFFAGLKRKLVIAVAECGESFAG